MRRVLPATRSAVAVSSRDRARSSASSRPRWCSSCYYAIGGTGDAPIGTVAIAMVGVHCLIGIGEGVITGGHRRRGDGHPARPRLRRPPPAPRADVGLSPAPVRRRRRESGMTRPPLDLDVRRGRPGRRPGPGVLRQPAGQLVARRAGARRHRPGVRGAGRRTTPWPTARSPTTRSPACRRRAAVDRPRRDRRRGAVFRGRRRGAGRGRALRRSREPAPPTPRPALSGRVHDHRRGRTGTPDRPVTRTPW